MGFNARIVQTPVTSGNINGAVAGTITSGPTIALQDVTPVSLSALVTVLAETNTITMTAVWEVSNDQSTWYRAEGSSNPTPTAVGTGTAGADAAVTRALSAPLTVYGWRFARCSILNGVATGTTSDTYSVRYSFARTESL